MSQIILCVMSYATLSAYTNNSGIFHFSQTNICNMIICNMFICNMISLASNNLAPMNKTRFAECLSTFT